MKNRNLVLPLFLLVSACAGSDYEPWLTRGQIRGSDQTTDRLSIERTACFGVCPVYEVIVTERDVLEFRGERFVAEAGGAVAKPLPKGSFDRLLDIARAHEFDDFDAAYPNDDQSNCPQAATDLPSVIVTLEQGGRKRAVSVYEGCFGFEGRDRFEAMVAAMDDVFDIDDMVGPREMFLGGDEDQSRNPESE